MEPKVALYTTDPLARLRHPFSLSLISRRRSASGLTVMDDSPSQPAQRAGLNYQSYLDDYQPDYSDDFKIFGRTNVSIKSSESTNISPATIFVSTKLGRNRSTESNDSGYSSYSARTVSSADSSSVYDIVRPPPVPPTNPRKSSYRSSHGTRRVIRPLWRKRA